MQCHETYRVHQTLLIQKAFHLCIFFVLKVQVLKLPLVKVSLCVPKCLGVFRDIPLWKVRGKKEL